MERAQPGGFHRVFRQCALKAARSIIEATPDPRRIRFAVPPRPVLWTVGEIDREQLDQLGDAPRLCGRTSRGKGASALKTSDTVPRASISKVQLKGRRSSRQVPERFRGAANAHR